MKTGIFILSVILISSIQLFAQDEIVLREELSILKPFVGKTWVSKEKHISEERMLNFTLKLEPMHGGKIIRIYGECKELNNQTDGYYYYDSDKKKIAFLSLTSNGNFAIGNVKEEDGKILRYGYTIFPDRKLEFRNTLEFTPDGKFIDKYFRYEDGEWKPGHSRVYTIE